MTGARMAMHDFKDKYYISMKNKSKNKLEWDGMKFNRTRKLHWRYSDPTRDFYEPKDHQDRRGFPIAENMIVFIRLEYCPIIEVDGEKQYTKEGIQNAPSIGLTGHSLTKMAYGIPNIRTKFGQRVKETPIYLMYDNMIYVHYKRVAIDNFNNPIK